MSSPTMKAHCWVGCVAVLSACAGGSASRGADTTSNVAAVRAPTRAPESARPDPEGSRRVRRRGWSLAVPGAWVDEETEQGTALHAPPVGDEPAPLRLVVSEMPANQAPRTELLRQLIQGYTERQMRVVTTREGSAGGQEYLDVVVDASSHDFITRLLGNVMVVGNRFAWAVCAARADQWSTHGPGCEAMLSTLQIAARTPAAAATGQRLITRDGIAVAIPTGWQDRAEDSDGTWQLHASQAGQANDPIHLVLTGGTLAVPREQVIARLLENLVAAGHTVTQRTTRMAGRNRVEVISLESHATGPVMLLQRMLFTPNVLRLITCATTQGNGDPGMVCAPLLETFRVEAD